MADAASKRVLVAGATGFVGRCLVAELLRQGAMVSVLARNAEKARVLWPSGEVSIRTADLTERASLSNVCEGIEVIFHLAGYAHAVDEEDAQAAATQHLVTVEGTRALLAEALSQGVHRLVYVSSVKAMGEGGNACLDESSSSEPLTAYGRSRRAAEKMLLDAARDNDEFAVAIIRLPLVYGRGNRGNLERMVAAIDRRRFPPLPKLANRRSMIWVGDVAKALLLAAFRPEARNQVYLVTDGHDYSTDRMYADIRAALGKPPAKWAVPRLALRTLAWIGDVVGRARGRRWVFDTTAYNKLTDSACYQAEKIRRDLGFRPSRTLSDELPSIIEEYRQSRMGS